MGIKFRKRDEAPDEGSAGSNLSDKVIRQRVAEMAYELYLKRGQVHGHDLEDWFEAERLILSELRARTDTKLRTPGKRVARSEADPKRSVEF